jgi:adenylosuccinate synthase
MIERLKEYGIKSVPNTWKNIVYSNILIENFINDVKFMVSQVRFANHTILNQYQNVIFENGQGLLLDQNQTLYGDNTTPSNTGILNPLKVINQTFNTANLEVCYVTRTYMTRHGVGRFETECTKSLINSKMFDETNVTNQFQDNLRYGELILPNLVNRVNSDFELALNNTKFNSKLHLTANVAVTHTNEYEIDYSRIRDKLINGIYVSDSRTRDSVKIFNEF